MKPKIIFLDEYSLSNADLSRVRSMGDYSSYYNTLADEVVERVGDAEIVITNKVPFSRETMKALPNLRLICVAATGVNIIDLEAAAELGIEVRNAAGYSTESVTETTIGAALALCRNIGYYDNYIKSGCYSADGLMFNFDRPTRRLCGKRWGVIGLGAIGRNVARVAQALGCEVVYASTSGVKREEAWQCVSLDELLRTSDVVSIHCPLNAATRNLIDKAKLEMMKPDALLINVARGGIVDEKALAEAIDEGKIGGAALDVFVHEPIEADSPLLKVEKSDRLLLSPHNAWSAAESITTLVGCIERNIEDYLARR